MGDGGSVLQGLLQTLPPSGVFMDRTRSALAVFCVDTIPPGLGMPKTMYNLKTSGLSFPSGLCEQAQAHLGVRVISNSLPESF